MLAQQKLDHHGLGKLRCLAEPAPGAVEALLQIMYRGREYAGVEYADSRARLRRLPNMPNDLLSTLLHLVLLVLPCIRHAEQNLPEARHAVAGLLGEIGTAVEGPAFRCKKDRHRPPAVSCHRGDGTHINTVQIRSLLAVDLYVDEMLIHQQGRFIVFERLVGHHMAPVAGRVADTQ